jgi:hypothetical protein
MAFVKKTDFRDRSEGEECRIKALKAPLLGSTYEVWFTKGGREFHARGRYPEVEGLMIRQEAEAVFYRSLVRASRKIGDECSRMEVSPAGLRCICSLALWSQDMATISEITGIGLEETRRITFDLFHAGYVTLVQKGNKTRMALTAKGWRAEDELADDALRTELLNRMIRIYSEREAECLKEPRI